MFLSFGILKLLQNTLHGSTIEVEVVGLRQLTPRIREYLLASPDGARLPRHDPGAHIEVHLAGAELGAFVRHYSLIGGAGAQPDAPHLYRIAVQREERGRGSDFIHRHLERGTRLRISPPRNHFMLGRNDGRSLLIAGGIGVTPIYSMLRSLVRRGRDFELVYSGRAREAMAYHEEVLALAGARGALHLSGEHGGSHLDLRELLGRQGGDTVAYVCGPEGMVHAVQAAARELGWAPQRVRSEFFGAGHGQDDVGFEVRLRSSGRSVTVGRNTSILDALISAGVELLFDCRRGECGLCQLAVVEADGPLEHRDRYLTAEERGEGRSMCICVSRIRGRHLVLDA